MTGRVLPTALLVLVLAAAVAQEKPADKPEVQPGHSALGDAFNEGPRQAAVLIPGTGNVDFPVTSKSDLAQKFFNQGVGQLHGFWYFEAERSFRQVAAIDPECAMAYWGMAMANINNGSRAADFMKVAVGKRAAAGRREQLWIDAYGPYYASSKSDENARRNTLVRALEDVIYEFPDDLEAKAFLVFQLWDNKEHKMSLPSRLAVDALARQVLEKNPLHPVHHYLIHLWNGADGDKRALTAAANCGPAAPGIAHMWHMPGHTYSNLKRYADAAWQQEASARVDHASMAALRIMPEQIHNYAHNNDWLAKNLTYIGRVHDALELEKNLIDLPRLGPGKEKASSMGRERLLDTLVRFELWDELLALQDTVYLETRDNAVETARRTAALGVAYFSKGEAAAGKGKLTALEAQLREIRKKRLAAAATAQTTAETAKKSPEQVTKAATQALQSFDYQLSTAKALIAELQTYAAVADGRLEEAKVTIDKARDISSDRRARLQLAIGNREAAVKLAREATTADTAQVEPLANLVAILWQTDQAQAARDEFARLRKLSALIDLDLPIMRRLAPIVADLELPADWRVAVVPAADLGPRPELASLGPFRWQPYAAPAWRLVDSAQRPVALEDFSKRPVLVLFYLGSGCARCIEQLNLFAPLTAKYAEAGIEVIAVSTDTPEGLQKTIELAKADGGFPFRIASDSTLETFRAYRAYDDFEKRPLHGTFLIDGQGLVRWQNIGFEPFRDPEWLLAEAQRLLRIDPQAKAPAVFAVNPR